MEVFALDEADVFHAIVRFLMSSAVVALDLRTLGGGPAGLFGVEFADSDDVTFVFAADDDVAGDVAADDDVEVVAVFDFQRSRIAFLSSLVAVFEADVEEVVELYFPAVVVGLESVLVLVAYLLLLLEEEVVELPDVLAPVVVVVVVFTAGVVVVVVVVAEVAVFLVAACCAFCIFSSASFFCQSFMAADCDIIIIICYALLPFVYVLFSLFFPFCLDFFLFPLIW